MSERYHQVGFLITFGEPLPGQEEAFRFDTGQLQAIAADTNLDWLKLSVCAEDSGTFNALEIQLMEGHPPTTPPNVPGVRYGRWETPNRPWL